MSLLDALTNNNVFDANGATSDPKFEALSKKWGDGTSPSEWAQKGHDIFSPIANPTINGKGDE